MADLLVRLDYASIRVRGYCAAGGRPAEMAGSVECTVELLVQLAKINCRRDVVYAARLRK